eukprot:4300369-Pyramimonas_sp.AAC.1
MGQIRPYPFSPTSACLRPPTSNPRLREVHGSSPGKVPGPLLHCDPLRFTLGGCSDRASDPGPD